MIDESHSQAPRGSCVCALTEGMSDKIRSGKASKRFWRISGVSHQGSLINFSTDIME